MRPNRHPADEIGDIRRDIKALKAREAALRKLLLHGPDEVCGEAHQVSLHRSRRRVLCREKLPTAVLNNPAYWEERETVTVVCRPLTTRAPVPAPALVLRATRPGDPVEDWETAEFEVIEREEPRCRHAAM